MEEIRDFEYRVPRFPTDFHFLLQTEVAPGVIHARCYEISEYGLAAWVSEALTIHTRVVLILGLAGDAETTMLPAIVTRRQGSDHVFAFLFPSTNELDHMRKFLLPMQSSES